MVWPVAEERELQRPLAGDLVGNTHPVWGRGIPSLGSVVHGRQSVASNPWMPRQGRSQGRPGNLQRSAGPS